MRTLLWLMVVASSLSACGRSSPPAGEPPKSMAVQADTEMACARTRSAGSWTQLVYRSETWRELAFRADGRDPWAWRRIAQLMEHNRARVADSACTAETIDNVRASAERLQGAR